MATDLIQIDQDHPLPEAIERAAAHLRRGDIVAIPTEGLYVLVADPLNLHAVGRVFAGKGSEIHRCLPMLISGTFMAEELAKDVSTRFHVLARHFWPGPLTMIVPSSAKAPLKVTGNTGRLAVRQSRSRAAQALLDWLDQPLIATSANISGQPTSRSGIEVFGTMDGRGDLGLERCTVTDQGDTTVDITEPYWKVIREGAVSEKEIADC